MISLIHNEKELSIQKESFEAISHLKRSRIVAQEILNYLSISLNKSEIISFYPEVIQRISDFKNVLQLELEKAEEILGTEKIKKKRLEQISTQIKNKIWNLQNPPKEECAKRPKLLCRLQLNCGIASGFHEILWCLIYAYYNNKLMFISMEWSLYFKGTNDENNPNYESWESFLKPLSSTCDYKLFINETIEEIQMNNDLFDRKLVNQLPKEFGSDIMKLVDSPNSWFHSKFSGYILRPQPRLKNYLDDFKRKINYSHPIVGVQVRRTDKLSDEAVFHRNADYMIHVKDFYDKLELTQKVDQRLVYIASDDQSVLAQFKAEYPGYEFIGNIEGSKSAEKQETRYGNTSLWGALTDIYLLSETDYIVCTFSSAVCRLSYQLMRNSRGDASFSYRSLDVPFHYHHSLTPVRSAAYNHESRSENEWNFKIGDKIHEKVRSDHKTEWFDQARGGRGWDSFFYASNTTTDQVFYKLYPHYKMNEDIELI